MDFLQAASDHFAKKVKPQKIKKTCKSRSGMPCTFCGARVATTWRPGPCGTATLCNPCGIKYSDNGKRTRCIDLVLESFNSAVWVQRNGMSWEQVRQADMKDPRIVRWLRHQIERREIEMNAQQTNELEF